MADPQTIVTWKGGLAFDVKLGEHRFSLDTSREHGGHDLGPSPKSLLLAGIAGCSGMDVVSILSKMKQPLDGLEVSVTAVTADEHPRIYTNIHLQYKVYGNQIEREKVEKAVMLSQTKYCGVAAMLGKAASITWDIKIE